MKAFDFFCMNHRICRSVFLGLMLYSAGNLHAAPVIDEGFTPSNELILNLPDKWLEPQASLESDFQNSPDLNNNLISRRKVDRKANIGCNMDVSELPVDDDSMTSRLEGKCNFDYRY